MVKVYSNALEETMEIDRIIGHIQGSEPGPTVVFFAGIHGNEPAGVFALKQVFRELKLRQTKINGQVYGIAGNLGALKNKVRFVEKDLNRIWSAEELVQIDAQDDAISSDEMEMRELYKLLTHILTLNQPPYYFIDLHTTSGDTPPFMVLNDSLLNRKFASNYPLPIILGIEEYLSGALLSYINELGYVSLGFEGGKHEDIVSIRNCIDFIRFTLGITELVSYSVQELDRFKRELLSAGEVTNRFYEIYYQYEIETGSSFIMEPGFENFQKIPKGTQLAVDNGNRLVTHRKRQIFMPLYQELGSEGFYFIRSVPKVLLWISKGLRKFKVDHILVRLPGIKWKSLKKDALLVDLRIAKFMVKSFFHLLGYRARQVNQTHLVVKSREVASKNVDYKDARWF
ncbi:succinylglutamate desuccinylase/aspartoacylase family protein [Flagellimonas myxillae]|uniref:succinylglutamate desuccinylase/aspartoacylase family protein n=1 Tax=Flagellimonas myxillae TaxID=2942214 RepID=UPI00201EF59E|nr:succinylglutamate desuccinylase/aspartoacylase family protein [Muricauda myxillae]MCL6267226.1 succinylglutamate desuccinylase/aspartoacylase family protein [Muricauda myxillae]